MAKKLNSARARAGPGELAFRDLRLLLIVRRGRHIAALLFLVASLIQIGENGA
jgi:hypothetical protein